MGRVGMRAHPALQAEGLRQRQANEQGGEHFLACVVVVLVVVVVGGEHFLPCVVLVVVVV